MLKRILAGTMGVSMILTSLATDSFNRLNADESDRIQRETACQTDLVGTNSIGNMIAEQTKSVPSAVSLNRESTTSNYINYLEFDPETGVIAVGSSQSESAEILVSFINENDDAQRIDVRIPVEAGEMTSSTGNTEIAFLPEYYVISAVIVNENGKYISKPYNVYKFTRNVQDIIASDIYDYNQDLVVNLDEDESTNFIVLSEDTICAECSEEVNKLVSADYENNVFVFDNIDESISGLGNGDYFFAKPDDDNLIAVSVETISIDGDKAVITADEDKSENVIDVVKIDVESDFRNAKISDMSCSDPCVYYPDYNEETGTIDMSDNTLRFGVKPEVLSNSEKDITIQGPSIEFELPFDITESDSKLKAEPSIQFEYTPYINIYFYKKGSTVDFSFSQKVEITATFNVDFGFGLNGDINGKSKTYAVDALEKGSPLYFNLCQLIVPTPVHFLYVKITPSVEISLKCSLSGSIILQQIKGLSIHKEKKSIPVITLTDQNGEKSCSCSLSKDFEVSGCIEVKIGLKLSFTCCTPKFLGAEIYVFVGATVETEAIHGDYPKLLSAVISKDKTLYDISLQADDVVELYGEEEASVHGCDACVDFVVSFIAGVDGSFTLFDYQYPIFDKLFGNEMSRTIKLPVYYFHFSSFDDFKSGECPHERFRTILSFVDSVTNEPLLNKKVKIGNFETATDVNGNAILYCYAKDYKILFENADCGKVTIVDCRGLDGGYVGKNEYKIPIEVKRNNNNEITGYSNASATLPAVSTKPVATTTTMATVTLPKVIHDDSALEIAGFGSAGTTTAKAHYTAEEWGNLDNDASYISYNRDDSYKDTVIYTNGNISGNLNLSDKKIKTIIVEDLNKYVAEEINDVTVLAEDYISAHCEELAEKCEEKYMNIPSDSADPDFINAYKTAVISKEIALDNEELAKVYVKYFSYELDNNDEYKKAVFAKKAELTDLINNCFDTIPSGIFNGLTNLETVVVPSTVKHIGVNAFKGCTNLKYIIMADTDEELDTFYSKGAEEVYTSFSDVLKNIEDIGNNAFSDCNNLEIGDLRFSDKLKCIGENTFEGCQMITSLYFPATKIEVSKGAFSECKNLKTIEIEDLDECELDLKERIYGGGDKNQLPASVKEVVIHKATSIPDNYFGNGDGHWFGGLETIKLPTGIKSIGNKAFGYCPKLKTITCVEDESMSFSELFKDVESFGSELFLDNNKIYNRDVEIGDLRFGDNTSSIGERAFAGNDTITSLYFPETKIKVSEGAFSECKNLKKIEIEDLDVCEVDLKGRIYGGGNKNQLPASVKEVVIHKATSIPDNYFGNGDGHWFGGLETIKLPTGIKSIGNKAFGYCPKLKTITCVEDESMSFSELFKDVESFGSELFLDNDNIYNRDVQIGDLRFGDNISSIGKHAFAGNDTITSVYFPANEIEIKANSNVFSGCKNLTKIEIDDIDVFSTPLKDYLLDSNPTLEELVIKKGTIIPNSYFSTGGYAHFNSLKTVRIPAIVSIGKSAFYNCPNIETIYYNGTKEFWDTNVNIGDGNSIINECYNKKDGKTIIFLGDEIMYGDINGDGKVTLSDALAVLQFIANEDKYPLTEAGIEAADVYNHGDGITAMDAVTIQMVDTGLIDQSMLPVSATDLN